MNALAASVSNPFAMVEEYSRTIPVAVGSLAKVLGIRVVKAVMPPSISGQISPSEASESGYEIKINKYEPAERQRFTIAHELAHFILHRDLIGRGIVDNVLYRSALSSRIETEANKLAADIIMPREQLRRSLDGLPRPLSDAMVENLASEYRVSVPAMRVRLGLT